MNFTGPVLLLVGPLLAALVTGLLRRWPRVVAVTGVVMVWLLWAMVMAIPLAPITVEQSSRLFAGDTFLIFGRSLILTEDIRTIFMTMLSGVSVLYLLSLLVPQGRNFIPGTLSLLSPLAASLMIEPASFEALLLLVVMALLATIIQADEPGSTRAALRYLIMSVLAIPLVLVSSWMLSTTQVALFLPASRLLLLGVVVLFAGFPFHIWVTPVVVKAPMLVSVFIFGLVQLVMVVFVFELLLATPWLQRDEWFMRTLAQSGMVTALFAGLLAATSTKFDRLIGSLLLLDLGLSQLTLNMSGMDGWNTAISLQLARFASLLLALVGLRLLSQAGRNAGENAFAFYRGVGRSVPMSTALFVYGCLSLIGMPMTAGFSAHWSLLVGGQVQPTPWLPYIVLLAMIGGMIGLSRALVNLLLPSRVEQEAPYAQPLMLRGLSMLLLLIGIWLAIFPQVIQNYATRLAQLSG